MSYPMRMQLSNKLVLSSCSKQSVLYNSSHVKIVESNQPQICVKGSLGSHFLKPSTQTLLVARQPSPAPRHGDGDSGSNPQVPAGFRGFERVPCGWRSAGEREGTGCVTPPERPDQWGSESRLRRRRGEPARTRIWEVFFSFFQFIEGLWN